MGFVDKTKELIGYLDFGELRIRRPKSLIFLCGGKNDELSELSISVREALLRHLPTREIIGNSTILLAERATEALPETSFENLLDLEECIAAIVDAVVLIVESAGSICELGAFAKTDEIRRKLVILLQNSHFNAKSFITLGALKYIKGNSDTAEIHPFDWTASNGFMNVPDYALQGMVIEITTAVAKIDQKPKFDFNQVGHRIILTLAFCHILRGAKLIELKECFQATNEGAVSEREIRKYLDTLRICGLVERAANGAKQVYFISLVDKIPIRAAFLDNTPDHERNILRWISSIAAAIAIEDPVRIKMFQEHNHAS